MGEYIVSARKYRPQTFDEVVGQEALTTTLKNAIRSGKLAHAYLFCGPRGVGKTTCARIFAKTINCLHPLPNGEACNECESCKAFNEQRSFNIQELDAASNNSVEEIRQLIEQVRIPPQVGKYKVFIIDEVHMLSTAAFNAFLKTLEEPPQHVIFILATTEKHKILPTILSRCQIYDFNRMEIPDIVRHLEDVANDQQIPYTAEALNVIAQKADGGMRDALSIFDQVVSFGNGKITYEDVIRDLNVLDYEYYFKITEDILTHNVPDMLLTLNEILNKGFQGSQFIQGLTSHFRNIMVSHDAVTLPLLEVSDTVKQRYQQMAQRLPAKYLYNAMKLCNDCDLNYRASNNKRLLMELTLIQLEQAWEESDTPGSRPDGRNTTLKPIHKTTSPASVPPTTVASQKGKQNSQVQAQTSSPDTPSQNTAESPVKTAPTTTVHEPETPYNRGNIPSPAGRKIPTFKRGDTHISVRLTPSQSSPTTNSSVTPNAGAVSQTPEPPKDSGSQTDSYNIPVKEEDIRRVWLEYAMSLPATERAISERMKIIKPILEDAATISIEVENENVRNFMKPHIAKIMQLLYEKLRNNTLKMTVNISKNDDISAPATPQQRFVAMSKKNPNLLKLKEMFGLDIM